MNREIFSEEENNSSKELLSGQRKKTLRSLLLVFTLIVGEELPIDTRPKIIPPTAELKSSGNSSKNPFLREIRERGFRNFE
jgi:hypothetical protein